MGDIVSPGGISKGVIHRVVDDFVNAKDSSGGFVNRAGFLDGLRKATTSAKYIALLQTIPNANPNDIQYLQKNFYTTPNGWQADGKVVYGILRVGLIEALRQAGSTLLLDSYWLAVAGNKSTETIVIKKDSHVTRIFLTPTMIPRGKGKKALAPPRQRTEEEDVWVVASRGSAREKKGHRVSDAKVVSVDGRVVTWQRLEFASRGASGGEP